MGPLVGVVAEDDAGRATGVYAYGAYIEASVQEGLSEEDHVIISGISVNGGK